jgi:hypothetical protein
MFLSALYELSKTWRGTVTANSVLDVVTIGVATATTVLGAAATIIASRNWKEIYHAEKNRATEIILRTRTSTKADDNLKEDEYAHAGRE